MQSDIQAAINMVCNERNLRPDDIYRVIESAVFAAWRKEHVGEDEDQRIVCEFDSVVGVTRIFRLTEVVTKLEDENNQITLAAARKIDPNLNAGDDLREEITPGEFGRIAAQVARQAIVQKLRDAQNNAAASFFQDRLGSIARGFVKRVDDRGNVEVDLEHMVTTIQRDKVIPGEYLKLGQAVRVYLEDIVDSYGGQRLVVSRTHPSFIAQLFAEEVPEIEDGKVEVKKIAREPGVRCKIAVWSEDESVDPVGACVGRGGVRIQAVSEELGNEYVDVIEWNDDRENFLRNALEPGEVEFIEFLDDDEPPRIICHVLEDNRAAIIGKMGQNVRLAGVLLGAEIDIVTFAQNHSADGKDTDGETKKIEKS